MKPIIIIHGWSDNSESFERLAKRLQSDLGRPTEDIWLADYISKDDDVKLSDVAAAMERAWAAKGISRTPNSVDVVIHSTGGLVVRLWMHTFYSKQGQPPPVANLVMLAPANFGSPLAHKGRSLIGRVVKGHNSDKIFQTGSHILRALEMASPISWALADDDRFQADNAFTTGGVLCTVIVGNFGYPGIKGITNEPGSDGTVYLSTANLNCAKIEIEVDRDTGEMHPRNTDSHGKIAYLVLNRYNHGSITGNEKRINKTLMDPIKQALEVTAGPAFDTWASECDAQTADVMAKYARRADPDQHGYQNTVFRVKDDQGDYVDDYTIEFYGTFDAENDSWASQFHRKINTHVHVYKGNSAYRSFLINVTLLKKMIDKINESLHISLSALPDINDRRTLAGYKTYGTDDIGQIKMTVDQLPHVFQPNRTLFIDITLPRYQRDEVFTLKNAD